MEELRAMNAELRRESTELKQQLDEKYNEEVSKLETFKMLIQSQIRGEASKLSRVENEKNDLLYQGIKKTLWDNFKFRQISILISTFLINLVLSHQ